MTQTPEPARQQLAASGAADLATAAPHAGPDRWRAETAFLLERWSEPARRYHTVRHLAEVLAAVEELAGAGSCTPSEATTARLAAWYHDVVYDPRAAAGSNEHRSAAIARDHLHRLGAAEEVIDAVERLVLMTLAHGTAGRGPTGPLAVMHDADLWVLAAPTGRFDQYCRQVRQEYAHVPPARYASARSEILEQLVAGPVYRTRHGTARWEDRARANVARELQRLAASR
ncbi:HD domain-containing protein [Ornithinicoccus halotolerans]|uniref:HD domain-containing protein n=1 Tax=Ornithinicoccus halotolerans TaxID=1748220 RepID=UPI0012958ADB|nr:metal-dependent phosphohydrolase [Ornithinicoccus halotolerans]